MAGSGQRSNTAPPSSLPVVNHAPGKVCLVRGRYTAAGGLPGGTMGITDLPILSMLRTRLEWGQERSRVLAENVANADTPNFRARDLAPLKFDEAARMAAGSLTNVSLARTEAGHIAGKLGSDSEFESKINGKYGVVPTGNGVNLEQEMMKVAANQMDYQAVTTLYARSLDLFKTALGKR